MPTFTNTEKRVEYRTYEIPFDTWDTLLDSVILAEFNLSTNKQRIVAAELIKNTPFDSGTLQLGHGAAAAQRETFGTVAEVDCQTAGTAALAAWRTSIDGKGYNGFSGLIRVFGRISVALPTSGSLLLVVQLVEI